MKRTITKSVSLLSGIAAMCMIVAPVSACSCAKSASAKAGLKSADAVFFGKVVDVGHQKFFTRVRVNMGNGKSKMVTAGEHFYKVKFVVSQSWKGAPRRTTSVLTFVGGEASCGYTFIKGNSYLVYANKEGKRRPNGQNYLQTSTCSRTARIWNAKQDLAELGKGVVPVAAPYGKKITPNAARAPMREVSVAANYKLYKTVDELDADAQIIISGSPTEDFLNRKHEETRYPDGSSQAFWTLTSVKVDEIIKKPTDLKLEVGQLFQVIEPVGIIGEEVNGGGKKIINRKAGYQEMKKDKKYIIFLKSNGLGGFSVINMNAGKFNLDGTDPDDLGKEHTEKKEKLKKEVLSKYADKLK